MNERSDSPLIHMNRREIRRIAFAANGSACPKCEARDTKHIGDGRYRCTYCDHEWNARTYSAQLPDDFHPADWC